MSAWMLMPSWAPALTVVATVAVRACTRLLERRVAVLGMMAPEKMAVGSPGG